MIAPIPTFLSASCPPLSLPSGVITLFNDIFPITFVAILNPKRFAGEIDHRASTAVLRYFQHPKLRRMVTGINIHFISELSLWVLYCVSISGGRGRPALIKTLNLWATLHFKLSKIGRSSVSIPLWKQMHLQSPFALKS